MRHRIQGEDGANAVEFALILPLLVMLIFGGITAGLALNARQQIDHAGREGVRYAATLPGAPGGNPCDLSAPTGTWHECVRDRVLATSVGAINLAAGGVCVSHIASDGTTTTKYFGPDIKADDGTNDTTVPCIIESPALSGERVQVKAIAPNQVNAVFVKSSFDLTTRSIARYEATGGS